MVRSSSCGGDRIMFWNVWGDLRMIPQIVVFTCQSWQPETCLSWMPVCKRQRLVGWFQEVCLQWQRLCSARFYQPSHTPKPINPENQKQLAVMVIQSICLSPSISYLRWHGKILLQARRSSVHLSAGWLEDWFQRRSPLIDGQSCYYG